MWIVKSTQQPILPCNGIGGLAADRHWCYLPFSLFLFFSFSEINVTFCWAVSNCFGRLR